MTKNIIIVLLTALSMVNNDAFALIKDYQTPEQKRFHEELMIEAAQGHIKTLLRERDNLSREVQQKTALALKLANLYRASSDMQERNGYIRKIHELSAQAQVLMERAHHIQTVELPAARRHLTEMEARHHP